MIEGLFTQWASRWAFDAPKFEEAWVPWGSNPAKPMPNVGDVYILFSDEAREPGEKREDTPHERHCGFILYVPESPDEPWYTADGGQREKPPGDGTQAAYINTRPWSKHVPPYPDPQSRKIWVEKTNAIRFPIPIEGIEYPYLRGGAETRKEETKKKDATKKTEGSGAQTKKEEVGNRLLGWLDIDSPAIRFDLLDYAKADWPKRIPPTILKTGVVDFDPPSTDPCKIKKNGKFTEYDYQFLGAWIDYLRGTRRDDLQRWLDHLRDPSTNSPPWQPPTTGNS